MKPFYINVYQDQRGQWYGGQFSSRRRAAKAATTVSSKCVGRLRVMLRKPLNMPHVVDWTDCPTSYPTVVRQ